MFLPSNLSCMNLNIELQLFLFFVACFDPWPPSPHTGGDLLPKGKLLIDCRVSVSFECPPSCCSEAWVCSALSGCCKNLIQLSVCFLADLGSSVLPLAVTVHGAVHARGTRVQHGQRSSLNHFVKCTYWVCRTKRGTSGTLLLDIALSIQPPDSQATHKVHEYT